jgi:sulfur carrier protein
MIVNGQISDLHPGETLAAVLAGLGLPLDARGVVPRAAWQTFALDADARVEVLTAMQGG